MIIDDKFVFIHNPHTGGAFIRSALKKAFPKATFMELTAWHTPIQNLDPKYNNRFKFGIIRNPWEWYVSFFHHQRPNGPLVRLFTNYQTDNFSLFLKNILSTDFIKNRLEMKFHPVGNPYVPATVPKLQYMYNLDIGFFSYRYIYMFFNNYENIFFNTDKNLIFKEHDSLISVNKVIKNEGMVTNLINMFDERNIQIEPKVKKEWTITPRENTVPRRHYKSYYTKELIELVQYKDRLIIDKYGYKF